MKSQINIRASALLISQLDELTEQLGTSITETISIAIDRMYQQEIKTMSSQFLPFDTDTRYSGNGHSPAMGQPGWGNTVKHIADGSIGHIIQSNTEKSLVQFGNSRDWYPNTDLQIHVKHITE